MYKSIIFDIGGVLVDFDPKAYLVDRLGHARKGEKDILRAGRRQTFPL